MVGDTNNTELLFQCCGASADRLNWPPSQGGREMFEITVEKDFAAAHRLREYDGNCEHLHGHNWHVKLTIGDTELDDLGLAIDFRIAKKWLADALNRFDHSYLNDLELFKEMNPSCELIAKSIYETVRDMIKQQNRQVTLSVTRVQVWESPGSSVTYSE